MENQSDRKKLPDISDFRRRQETVKFGFRWNLIKYFRQYTNRTGIHGFLYLGEEKRPIFERIFWSFWLGISIILCSVLTFKTWEKWDSSPVIVSFSKAPTSIWKIPFPAVTICPYTKSTYGMYNYTESLNKFMDGVNFTEAEAKNFSASSLVCDNYLYSEGNKTIGLDAIDHITAIAPEVKNILFQCRWDLHPENCSVTFRKILTEDGLCYTSNMLGRKEFFNDNVYLHYDMAEGESSQGWSLQDGYPDTANKDSFPRRAKFAGFTGSQVFVLTDFDQNLDYSCKGPIQGVKIILHNPAEMPRVRANYLQAPLNEELLVIITPDMMTTSDAVHKYNPHKRECFFPNERHLSFFQVYTQQNCEFECLTNYTLAKCGCVAFYMPYEKSTPICGPGSMKCMLEAESELISQTVNYGPSEMKLDDESSDVHGFVCDCLPACSSLAYNAEFSQSRFNWRELFMAFRENMSELPGET
ncbi:pickpocket protein 28-like isoform X2 [Anoplophora glabripennis]|uniref:pickpocket protein 28-like isoform X2 n=1 Tax=Anoplophora glabripennis TaxID=217634 RepID=UPI000C786F0C|nr:pickpocket protein 28-like isoform X2 [Anoplophora glabripennis]